MTSYLRKIIGTLIALAGPLFVVGTYVSWRDRLPDPLPTHWSSSGPPDGFSGTFGFFVTITILCAVLALGMVLAIWLVRPAVVGRMSAAFVTFLLALFSGVWGMTAGRSLDVADSTAVQLPFAAVALLLFACVAVAVGVGWLLPGRWRGAWGDEVVISPRGDAPVFANDEAVVWVDRVHSPVMTGVATVLFLGALATAIWIPVDEGAASVIVTVVLLVSALPVLWMASVTVRVDADGVHTLWGLFGWPRSTIPLSRIKAVRAEKIVPMRWGGWGYRMSKRGTATVMRGGPGLVIERTAKWPTHAITIPHAAEGAQIIEALQVRERARRERG